MKYIYPELSKGNFTCPHCNITSEQTWTTKIDCHYNIVRAVADQHQSMATHYTLNNIKIAKCSHCQNNSIWSINPPKMIYPLTGNVESANEDLPEEIKLDFNEAKAIVNISPRGAAALLRLAIQKLCIHLGEKGKNINEDIESLVNKGLPKPIQQSLDIVRVTGNNAVHPLGVIDLNDSSEIAVSLFSFC